MIQYYEWESGARFVCTVADGGIGIRRSLERNPDIRERVYYDWDAIELAMQERISGTGIPTRGIGLYAISDDMRKPGHHLLIHSWIGLVSQSEELEADARRTTLFPGTLAYGDDSSIDYLMKIFHLLERRALVTRGSARSIAAAVLSELKKPTPTLELDFSGVEAVTPSFIDELISELSGPAFAQCERILFLHPPSRLSEKFRAIGRSRGISIDETPAKAWIIVFSPSTGTVDHERADVALRDSEANGG